MKLKHYSLVLMAFSLKSATAQIQLTEADIYLPGNYKMAQDNSGGFNIGTPGGNKTWDFSTLKKDISFQFDISSYTSGDKKNDANYIKTNGTDTFEIIKKTSNALYFLRPIVNFSEISFYPMKRFQFPMKHNDSLVDSIGIVLYYKGSDLGVEEDSVRLIYREYESTLADAWGTLKLPNGTFQTLRVRTKVLALMRMEGKSGTANYTHIPDYDYTEQFTEYNWYSTLKGTSLATYNAVDDYMNFMEEGKVDFRRPAANETAVKFVNPMSEAWKVSNPGKKEYTFTLFDATGKTVQQGQLRAESETNINTSDMLQGIYYLELVDALSGARQGYRVMK